MEEYRSGEEIIADIANLLETIIRKMVKNNQNIL